MVVAVDVSGFSITRAALPEQMPQRTVQGASLGDGHAAPRGVCIIDQGMYKDHTHSTTIATASLSTLRDDAVIGNQNM